MLDQEEWQAHRKLQLRPALPFEYLLRLGLQNVVFGDMVPITGIDVSGAIHTSQPWVPGGVPTMQEVASFMGAHGFQHLPRAMMDQGAPLALTWYRVSDRVLVSDAKPANFVQSGSAIFPVDVVISIYPEALMRETAGLNGVDWGAYIQTFEGRA